MAALNVSIQEGMGPLVAPLPFSEEEFQRRLNGVRVAMAARGLDAFVSFTPENIYYLTGHDTPGYYFYQACVVTHEHRPVNVLRRIETTNTLGRSWSRLAVGYEDRQDPVETTLALLRELSISGRPVGAEAESWFVSPKRYSTLRQGIEHAGGRLVDASGIVEQMRVIKSPEEITCIRAGARAVEKAMAAAIGSSREGTNENDVAAAIVGELIRAGGEYAGLPPFVTSGPRTSLCHSTWAGRTYQQGDVLNYELPGVINRYCAALFRCGTVGRPSPEITRRASVVREALETVLTAIKPGVPSQQVHSAARGVYEKHGFGHLHGHRTGYSVGINYPPDWGEGHIMSLWSDDDRPLRSGMTFHLVPGFGELGKYNLVISETILVTDTGCETLTRFPRELFTA